MQVGLERTLDQDSRDTRSTQASAPGPPREPWWSPPTSQGFDPLICPPTTGMCHVRHFQLHVVWFECLSLGKLLPGPWTKTNDRFKASKTMKLYEKKRMCSHQNKQALTWETKPHQIMANGRNSEAHCTQKSIFFYKVLGTTVNFHQHSCSEISTANILWK